MSNVNEQIDPAEVQFEIDGNYYDGDGVWIGRTDVGVLLADPDPNKTETTRFEINDTKTAEWLLETLSKKDADILALTQRKSAYVENMDSMIKAVQRDRDSLLYCFRNQLEDVARANLPKGSKTFTTPFGKVAFRSVPASVKVADPNEAYLWAIDNCKDAARIKREVLVSKITPDWEQKFLDDPTLATANGFEIVNEWEKVSVDTGVKKAKEDAE